MNTYTITFVLNSTDKICINLERSLEELHCCDGAPIVFFQNNNRYLLSNDSISSVRDNIKRFADLLKRALDNKLMLDNSIKPSLDINKDIGYLYNEDLQNKPGLVYTREEEEYDLWVG